MKTNFCEVQIEQVVFVIGVLPLFLPNSHGGSGDRAKGKPLRQARCLTYSTKF